MVDRDDPAVVIVFAHPTGDLTKGNICGGTLASPRVIVTAGHCESFKWLTEVAKLPNDFDIHVLPVNDFWAQAIKPEQALEGTYQVDPQLDPRLDLSKGHDTGAFILKNPLPNVKPLRLRNRAPIEADREREVRQVGYGYAGFTSNPNDRMGLKRFANTKPTFWNDTQVFYNDEVRLCWHDSGGPTLDGEEIISIDSWSPNPCIAGSWQTRSDIAAAFINPIIAANP
jgi:hypothetical protein